MEAHSTHDSLRSRASPTRAGDDNDRRQPLRACGGSTGRRSAFPSVAGSAQAKGLHHQALEGAHVVFPVVLGRLAGRGFDRTKCECALNGFSRGRPRRRTPRTDLASDRPARADPFPSHYSPRILGPRSLSPLSTAWQSASATSIGVGRSMRPGLRGSGTTSGFISGRSLEAQGRRGFLVAEADVRFMAIST